MKVNLAFYDSSWPALFDAEKHNLFQILPIKNIQIEHIGSTAVPGLMAKPVIDLLIGLPYFSDSVRAIEFMEELEYHYISEYETRMPYRKFFHKDQRGIRVFNVHMVEIGTDFWKRHLAFRDHLKSNENIRLKYQQLKITLAEKEWENGNAYADAKSKFIREVEAGLKIK